MTRSLHLATAVARARAEVLADVAAGTVPRTVNSFAELHDYVDANGYGGAFESDFTIDQVPFWNEVQEAIDAWIKGGGLARPQYVVYLMDHAGPAPIATAPTPEIALAHARECSKSGNEYHVRDTFEDKLVGVFVDGEDHIPTVNYGRGVNWPLAGGTLLSWVVLMALIYFIWRNL